MDRPTIVNRLSLASLIPWRLRSFNNLVRASPNPLFAGVLRTPPCPVDAQSPIEVHSLVCRRDVNMMITSAKSLLRWCPPVALVFHDDGSLRPEEVQQLQRHFPGLRLVGRAEADEEMRRLLPPEVFEKRKRHVFLLKLFDVNVFNKGSHTILLDSDIVFLRRPDAIVDWMADPAAKPFYNRDPAQTYRAKPVPESLQLPPHLNAGFMGFRGRFSVEQIVETATRIDYWLEDQTIYAPLLAGRGAQILDPEAYRVYLGETITARTAMVHFISTKRFERLLYPRLAWAIFRTLRQTGR